MDVHKPSESIREWQIALDYLKDGNRRFVENNPMPRDGGAEDRAVLKNGQKPFAVIVTCSDSRVSPELYFDQKHGDIFVIRNAGNIADVTALGSIEYAVEHLHVPLVVVVGHSSCGAVTGALNGGAFPANLQFTIDTIASAIKGNARLEDAICANTDNAVRLVRDNEVVKKSGATVIGAHYDIESGTVTFLGQ